MNKSQKLYLCEVADDVFSELYEALRETTNEHYYDDKLIKLAKANAKAELIKDIITNLSRLEKHN